MTIWKSTRLHASRRRLIDILVTAAAVTAPVAARANNYGESAAWQFRSSADKVNQAALLDLIQKQRGGYYAAPIYNTTIARQYNCSIAPVATGNQGYQSATANSPTVTGASSQASGNTSAASATDGHGAAIDTQQSNTGAVSSGVVGSTDTSVHGTASQALNSTQSNSGAQSASVSSSSACAFGALN
ncbi:MAG: hypothetical protein JWL96_4586 [Sphingomonas bacterium]|uniref:hypothetical protein n=1 Tax=Sphingomonas bacterium TaxID=1895847 RepID=UPI002629429E|nr:hypothetical protein [Sphingomonas bacterium]MDB5712516.1 hypothetical protein [Sphingomonas bacterium]